MPVDKRLVNLLPRDRPYTFMEAYFSLRFDIEEGRENSINGYAALWGWSRNKVRNFVEGLRTGKGHIVDNQRTGKGQEIRIVFNNLDDPKDRQGTGKGQAKDRQEDTTIDPNPKPDTKPSSPPPSDGEGGEGKPEVVFTAPVMWISHKLAELILQNNQKNRELQDKKREVTVLRWAKDIDKMIRIDGRDAREVAEVVIWCQKDSFWSQNILSGAKLREQYDKLTLKMKGTALSLVKPAGTGRSKTESNIDAARQGAALLGVTDDETE